MCSTVVKQLVGFSFIVQAKDKIDEAGGKESGYVFIREENACGISFCDDGVGNRAMSLRMRTTVPSVSKPLACCKGISAYLPPPMPS